MFFLWHAGWWCSWTLVLDSCFFVLCRCFGNALGNCILNKEYLIAINKIPKQVRYLIWYIILYCCFVFVFIKFYVDAESPHLFLTQPSPPLDPAQTKRSDHEPLVEKARFSSLTRDEKIGSAVGSTTRAALEPRVLNQNQNQSCSAGHGSGTEAGTPLCHPSNVGPAPVCSSAETDRKNENVGPR